MFRRDFLKLGAGSTLFSISNNLPAEKFKTKPNIIYILADDLGYAELGCYGQEKIKTPNIDRLAEEGMRFTQHYSGHAVCAPSRCTLMTGFHTGHAYVRNNLGAPYAGQLPIPENTVTLPHLLKKAGYTTGCIGKWGLGGPGSTGVPWKQGVDLFFGYLDQWRAHNYYPTYLYRNEKKVPLNNHYFSAHQKLKSLPEQPDFYKNYMGKEYAPDKMAEEAYRFIRENKLRSFFLALTYTIPHVALQVPEVSLKEYLGKFHETPYSGNKGYLPHSAPRAAYAAMVTHMDKQVGRIMALIKELGLDENTIVIFSSDNGPTFNGGSDSEFFNSAGPFRGLKGSLYEGGIHVPFIARWKGHIPAGKISDHISAFWDIMPTLLELSGKEGLIPDDIDGISLAPVLLGRSEQKKHDYLYWETHNRRGGGIKAVRMGVWKALAFVDKKEQIKRFELYNLKDDIAEKENVAEKHPEIVTRIKKIMKEGRGGSEYFNFGGPTPKQKEFRTFLKELSARLKAEDKK